MNYTPEQARELVAQALESGEHIQGTGCLERKNINGLYRCCLGVAMRVYMEHENNSISCSYTHQKTIFRSGPDRQHETLLPEVRRWLGLRSEHGGYESGSLIHDNDRGVPFVDMAKLFRNPPGNLLE